MTARADIDCAAITHNVARLAALAPDSIACAVVKADGYGHGAIRVAQAAIEGGATWLAVATPAEAAAVAAGGIAADTPILLLSEPDPSAFVATWADRPAGLRAAVSSIDGIAALEDLIGHGDALPVHFKVDTGMHRMGADLADVVEIADRIAASSQLDLEGVWTHFAVADDPTDSFTATQVERFDAALEELRGAGHEPPMQHLCNSAATISAPNAHRDLIRLGIAMYGVAPSAQLAGRIELAPALRLRATVTGLRTVDPGESVAYGRHWFATTPTRVATVDIGYADGVRRSSAEAGVEVLVRGRRSPILGVVTMDQTMIAVADNVELGDEVVLIGAQGDEMISAEEIAARLGTIGYEILTDLGSRILR